MTEATRDIFEQFNAPFVHYGDIREQARKHLLTCLVIETAPMAAIERFKDLLALEPAEADRAPSRRGVLLPFEHSDA